MTKEEAIQKAVKENVCSYMPVYHSKMYIDLAMEEYAKYHSALAFDAGFDLCAMYETNFPANSLTKEEYLSKTFNS